MSLLVRVSHRSARALAAALAALALLACDDPAAPRRAADATSFEGTLHPWRPVAIDTGETVGAHATWTIVPSRDASAEGEWSAELKADNRTDAVKLWLERSFLVESERAQEWDVTISFDFATRDYGELNHWTIIAGAFAAAPRTAAALSSAFREQTGGSTGGELRWLSKRYTSRVVPVGNVLHVAVGVWGTYEISRSYYIDNVRVRLAPARTPGLQLVYDAGPDGAPEIFVTELGAAAWRLLPPGTAGWDAAPSPDGRSVAFTADEQHTSDLFIVSRDGTGLRRLAPHPEPDDQPSWSPDSRWIAFRSYRAGSLGQIWIAPADGSSRPVSLTPDPLPGVIDSRRPAWSPDGRTIAYATNRGGNYDIWTMRRDGSEQRRLTNTEDFDTEPAWSPDGKWIVFRRSSDARGSQILIIPSAGGQPLLLPAPAPALTPAWSPDGRLIAFESRVSDGTSRIYTIQPDGAALTLRAQGRNPAWLVPAPASAPTVAAYNRSMP